MKENDLIVLLQKCLNVPKLAFGANTVEPYKELQYITEKADYILYLQSIYLINKNNLKIYKNYKREHKQNIRKNKGKMPRVRRVFRQKGKRGVELSEKK